MKAIKTISIKCETKDYLKLEDMTVMQGNLKERNDTDYEKIKKSILTYSFSFPFFIWKSGKTNYLIDGTGRHSCLLRMQEEGYIIPDLPVVYISCKDKKDAKQKLLRLNSQYGKMSKESVVEFAEDIDMARVEASYQRAQSVLNSKSASDTDTKLAEARLRRALVRKYVASTK